MEIGDAKKDMIVGVDERDPTTGRWKTVYGTIAFIDEERKQISISVFSRNSSDFRTFDADVILPMYVILSRQGRRIGNLRRRCDALESFVLHLARGKVEEVGVQEILEVLSNNRRQ